MKREIFKVQVPIRTNAKPALALIYNKSRSIQIHCVISPEIKKFMGADFKKYAWGKSHESGLDLDLDDVAPAQEW